MTGVQFEKRVKLAAKMLEENPNVGFDKVLELVISLRAAG